MVFPQSELFFPESRQLPPLPTGAYMYVSLVDGTLLAYLAGANGETCYTHTRQELAAWFQGMAHYARKTRG